MAVIDTKKKTLGSLPNILPKQWQKIGIGIISRIRADAQKGKSQDDSDPTFAEYSTFYKDLKIQGLSVDGRATSTQISPPNLKYTGAMLKKITVKNPQKNGVTISFQHGERVLKNIRMENRNIFDIRKKNVDWITNEVLEIFNNNAKKLPSKEKIIIGK